jgi:uncharacterized protein involved in exopolysaccharide biosynthesis
MKNNYDIEDDEITLRELLLKGKFFVEEIFRHWRIVLLCIVFVLAYQVYDYVRHEPVYTARMTFSVDEEEGGSASGITGLLGQFGLSSARPSRYNLDKILALCKSRRVIEQTLFVKADINGEVDYLANHLLRAYATGKEHEDGKTPGVVSYFTHDSLALFNRDENEMLMGLYGFIIGPPDDPKKALLAANYNEDTNIMSIEMTTNNETLSIALTESLFNKLSEYYINKAVEKQLQTLTIIEAKKDSVLGVLKDTEYKLAQFSDSHQGLMRKTDQISELRLRREITALSAMYAEVLKNTEVADFSLKNKTPFIQVIDSPLAPIEPTRLSLPRKIVLGFLIGGIIGSVFIVGRRILQDLLVENNTAKS